MFSIDCQERVEANVATTTIQETVEGHAAETIDGGTTGETTSTEDIKPRNYATINYPIIPRDDLDLLQQFSSGSFGCVFHGHWKSKNLHVAIKKVFQLDKEADILSLIRHRNIIKFYGVSKANPDFFIVTEFAEHGSLYDYIHGDNEDLHFEKMLTWATQIARGISYLHYEAPHTIIHRDLKSKNILLASAKDVVICKLCDFGTSKEMTNSVTKAAWFGTPAYMSPEIIAGQDNISTATDVFSFAVVLWELIAREIPYAGLTEYKIFSIISQHGVRTEPKNRLNMKQVLASLDLIAHNSDLTHECHLFMERKQTWLHEIESQTKQLNELKMDLTRKTEELEKRERLLKEREVSHRNLKLLKNSTNELSNAINWNEEQVAEWAKNVVMCIDPPPTAEIITTISQIIKEYNIDGVKLLSITAKQLELLGVENIHLRVVLALEIEHLKAKRFEQIEQKHFPSLQMSFQMENQKKFENHDPLKYDISVQILLYLRTTKENKKKFKIFVDSDWTSESTQDEIPIEIIDSSNVIKEVCITLLDESEVSIMDVVRCDSVPFGHRKWVDVPDDNSYVNVLCQVNFSEQVLAPTNKIFKTKIHSFDQMNCILEDSIKLKINPFATETSLSRAHNSYTDVRNISNSGLRGVWKNLERRDSKVTTKHNTPSDSPEILNGISSPLGSASLPKPSNWATVVGGNKYFDKFYKNVASDASRETHYLDALKNRSISENNSPSTLLKNKKGDPIDNGFITVSKKKNELKTTDKKVNPRGPKQNPDNTKSIRKSNPRAPTRLLMSDFEFVVKPNKAKK
uniref:Protein kinase domain-containing protein n=1 Tax=Rhabditophanes sp. KR3021 TaxID=114890 RepID=A0AC35UEW2_9BILA